MLRLLRARAAVLACGLVCAASNGWAQRVAIVRPSDADPVLVDAYNRLNAELRLQAFQVLVLDRQAYIETRTTLVEAARNAEALAAISFVRRGGESTVDVWLVDRATGKTTVRTLEPSGAKDAASVLAIRAVDLLRVSLQELAAGAAPASDVQHVSPHPASRAALDFIAPRPAAWSVQVEGLMLVNRPAFGPAYGAGLAVLRRLGSHFEIGMSMAGTFIGAGWSTGEGEAWANHLLGCVELRASLLRLGVLEFGPAAVLGVHRLEARGQASAPLLSQNDEVWSFLVGLGAQGQARISSTTSFVLALRALVLTPKPGVEIGQQTVVLDVPVLQAGAGLVMGL